MPTSIVLLADDLSGALDSAVPFGMAGHRVAVAIDAGAVDAAMADAPDVLAINLDCREAAADLAADKIRALAPMLASIAPRIVMVKIDSRMKGPVAALVAAALTATGRRGAIVCPAVPDMGRFVVDGRVVGIGVDRPIEVAAHFPAKAAVTYRDADSAAMMRELAATIVDRPESTLAVGARGLAQALAAVTAPRSRPPIRMPERARAPLIVAIGSRDPITAEQLDRLSRATSMVDGNALLRSYPRPIHGSIVLIRPDGSRPTREPCKVSAELAEDVARLVDACAAGVILASGGDTAMAIARRLGIRVLVPQGELAPGVPLSVDAERPDLLIATKSGGFGGPDTLVTCLGAIFRDEARSPRRAGTGA